MIQLRALAEGVEIAVRAQPGARRNAVVGEQNGCLKVAVNAPPEKGRANEAIVEVLAEALGIKRKQIELTSGATSREKKFLLQGTTLDDITTKIVWLLSKE